jgi:thiamine-phosphate pyrophosphorylase
MSTRMRGLYAICDTGALGAAGFSPVAFARAVLPARPCALQLRAKGLSSAAMVSLLREIAPHARACGVPLYANDRPDVAALSGCDGVHLGQTDMSIDVARRLAPGLAIGLSTHNPAQLEKALLARPTYVAMGPVFATRSKDDPDPVVGVDGLRAAREAAMRAGVPLVAIGGISLLTLSEVKELADAVAVISDLTKDARTLDDVAARALLFANAFDAVASSGATPSSGAIAGAAP